MPVMLDSEIFPATERDTAFPSALEALIPPNNRVVMARGCEGLVKAAVLGPDRLLTEMDLAGDLLLRETPTPPGCTRDSSPERVSVAAVTRGQVITNERGKRRADNARLRLLDLTDVYGIEYVGGGHAIAFDVDCASIGLSVDAVRVALDREEEGALGDLLRRHLVGVSTVVDGLSPAALAAVGASTEQLVRGYVMSASGHDADRKEAASITLMMRIDDYISRCLNEPDLTPLRIAAVHNISLRQLYVLFSKRGRTPSEWITTRRLEAAKEDLAHRAGTVAATAQRWGFKDQSHFTRRFKAAYGVTPRDFSASAGAADSAR
jgi:AraC-like DNA-binding protein